jgi:hypothetical protein
MMKENERKLRQILHSRPPLSTLFFSATGLYILQNLSFLALNTLFILN